MIEIEPFDKSQHDRTVFSCGVPALDTYLKQQANQDVRRLFTTLYVAVPAAEPGPSKRPIIGYYTLSNCHLDVSSLPEERVAAYGVLPATLLGRLAVDSTWQGQGVGRKLLRHALHMCIAASEFTASAFIVVQAKDDEARRFYEGFGFQACRDLDLKLFLPMQQAKDAAQP